MAIVATTPPPETKEFIDTTQLQFSKDTSEAGMLIENEVIEE